MGKRRTGLHPLAYMGVEPSTPPQLVNKTINPNVNLTEFNIGTIWINTETEAIFMLTNLDAGVATWTPIESTEITINADTGSATEVGNQLTFDGGGVIETTATGSAVTTLITNGTDGQLIIAGGAEPIWANLTSSGGSVTITETANGINLEAAGVAALTQLDGDTGSAVPLVGVITLAGGTNITSVAGTNTVTFNLDASPSLAGTLTCGTGLTVTTGNTTLGGLTAGVVLSSAAGLLSNTDGTDGQLVIGSTAGDPAFASLTSTSGTILITEGSNTLNIESASSMGSPYLLVVRSLAGTISGNSKSIDYDQWGSSSWVLASNLGGATKQSFIYTSPDGISWTLRKTISYASGTYPVLSGVACGSDGYCVTTLTDTTSAARDVWTATDPTSTWTANSNAFAAAPGGTISGISHGGSHWIASADSLIYWATNPTASWTRNSAGLTEVLLDSVYGGSTWVIVGENGFIATATDPTGGWTSRTSSFLAADNINGVTYSASLALFCAVGDNGKIATSPDGITWTQRINIFNNAVDASSIKWDSSRVLFVAVGNSMTALSYNGTLWFQDYKSLPYDDIDIGVDDSGNIMTFRNDGSGQTILTNT